MCIILIADAGGHRSRSPRGRQGGCQVCGRVSGQVLGAKAYAPELATESPSDISSKSTLGK